MLKGHLPTKYFQIEAFHEAERQKLNSFIKKTEEESSAAKEQPTPTSSPPTAPTSAPMSKSDDAILNRSNGLLPE